MISILVTNPKGGCGKTTIATNLASAFANAGLTTAFADTDRQRSGLNWLASRPKNATPIRGLDWVRKIGKAPQSTARLVIDSPASLRLNEFRELVRAADVVVIPVLPSVFDVGSTMAFLKKLEDVKPIRKNRKPFAVVRNRVRLGGRAIKHLDQCMVGTRAAEAGWLTDRSLYNEVAWSGLSVFDLRTQPALKLQRDWIPLVRFIENSIENSID